MAESSLIVAGATRPLPGESSNGDAWHVDWHEGRCRVAIIDGLGHGAAAAQPANLAVRALAARPELDVEASLRLCHGALAGTRGAAISIASIDPIANNLTYSGVGNAEARLLTNGRMERLIAYRGIVGAVLPKVRSFAYALASDWMLVMHTDGIRSHFELDGLSEVQPTSAQTLADAILHDWARPTDDATVVVVARVRPS